MPASFPSTYTSHSTGVSPALTALWTVSPCALDSTSPSFPFARSSISTTSDSSPASAAAAGVAALVLVRVARGGRVAGRPQGVHLGPQPAHRLADLRLHRRQLRPLGLRLLLEGGGFLLPLVHRLDGPHRLLFGLVPVDLGRVDLDEEGLVL